MTSNLYAKASGVYLLSHSVGLAPISSRETFLQNYLAPWEQADEQVWQKWLEATDNFRSSIASVIQAETRDICPQTNVSSAFTKILQALPAPSAKKTTVLLSEEDFPSMGFVMEKAQALTLKFIPSSLDLQNPEVWNEYLSDDIYLVLLTHVQSNTGCKLPIAELCKIAKERSIYTAVDIAQSAGVIPVDVNAWKADFVMGSCVKWLCGGPGAGYLWVNPKICDMLSPSDVGWFSHDNPLEFDIRDFRYANDALRFWGGTPSVAPFVIAANSIQTSLKIGIKNIESHNRLCKTFLLERIPSDVVVSPLELNRQGGTLILNLNDKIVSKLKEKHIYFDKRRLGIRLSPHIYTTVEELGEVVQCF